MGKGSSDYCPETIGGPHGSDGFDGKRLRLRSAPSWIQEGIGSVAKAKILRSIDIRKVTAWRAIKKNIVGKNIERKFRS